MFLLDEYCLLDMIIYRNYLKNRGHDIRGCLISEGYAISDIAKDLIKQVIKFPEEKFIRLTK